MRPTLHAIPASADMLKAARLPLAVVVTPLAPPAPGDSPLPLILLAADADGGGGGGGGASASSGLPRCPACRAYANPGWVWHDRTGGRTFTCNLCGSAGDAPPGWGAPGVDPASGARADAASRPELCCGSVEYAAPPSFCARPPRPPSRLFVLDASFGAVASGLLAAGAAAAAAAVSAMPPDALVGLATFDGAVHFYALGAGGGPGGAGGAPAAEEAAVLVVADVAAPFAPAPPARLLAPAGAALAPLTALLARLPSQFADTRVVASAGGAALAAAVDAVAAAGGGRVHALLGGPPRSGFLALAGGRPVGGAGVDAAPAHPSAPLPRPASAGPRAAGPEPVPPASAVGSGGDSGVGPSSVGRLTPPADCGWPAWAAGAAERQVAVDLALAPPGGSGAAAAAAGASAAGDAAALRAACDGTGGSFTHYPAFSAAACGAALAADWVAAVASPHAGWEGVGRLRVSGGLVVTALAGPVHRRVPGDVDFPGLGPDTTVVVTLAHDGGGGPVGGRGSGGGGGDDDAHHHHHRPPPPEAALQWALAYTTPTGARRVRVHTLRLPVADSLGALFRGADGDALGVVWAARCAASLGGAGDLVRGREAVRGAPVPALAAYRARCAASAGAGQLILPEALKLAPLAGLALSKSPAWAPRTPPDERAVAAGGLARGLPPSRLARALAPRLLPLHLLLPCPATGAAPAGWPGWPSPPPLPLSAEAVEAGGVYLLAGDTSGALWFGPRAHHAWPGALVGDGTGGGGGGPVPGPGCGGNPTARALSALAAALGAARGDPPLRVAALKRGPAGDAAFYGALVEDRGPGGPSYVEHLCWVHRQVQKALQ